MFLHGGDRSAKSNHLQALELDVFSSLGSLTSVDLQDNDLYFVTLKAISNFCRNSNVDFKSDGNPTTCNCEKNALICNCAPFTKSVRSGDKSGCIQPNKPNTTSGLVCQQPGCVLTIAGQLSHSNLLGCNFLFGTVMLTDTLHNVATSGGDMFTLDWDWQEMNNKQLYIDNGNALTFDMCEIKERIMCPLPSGMGQNQPFRLVYRKDKTSIPLSTGCVLSYGNPNVTNITGCPVRGCSREGSDHIFLKGNNFGGTGALVFINGRQSSNCSHGRSNQACGNSTNAIAEKNPTCHQRIECTSPALTTIQFNSSVVVVNGNEVGFYGGFKYTMCGVNTHQEHSDGTCSLCESGKKSEGKDAVSCDSCKFWYLGSTGHCEVPVFGIILATSIPLTFALIIGLVLRVWHAQHTLAKRMISEMNKMNRKQHADMELMASAWKFDWEEVKLQEPLASGANGEVWRATLKEQFTVAVKKMFNTTDVDIDSDPEINFLKQARHQRLVLFLGCGRMDSGDLFMVIEFCGAGDFTHFLYDDDDIPTWDKRLSLLLDVTHGLMYLHVVHAAVHRDLKSDNVLLANEHGQLRAKLSDFGTSRRIGHPSTALAAKSTISAKIASGPAPKQRSISLSKTLTSATGTLQWMAPEIISRMHTDEAHYGQPADIYSFAMILYEALELKRPWHELVSNFTHPIMDAIITGKRPSITLPLSKLHPKYVSLMTKCWHQDPSFRPTVEEVATLLEAVKLVQDDGTVLRNADDAHAATDYRIELRTESCIELRTKSHNPLHSLECCR